MEKEEWVNKWTNAIWRYCKSENRIMTEIPKGETVEVFVVNI